MRWLLKWAVVLGLLVGLGAVSYGPAMAWWKQRSAPRYLTVKVSRGRVETNVNSTGTVKPVRSVSVGSFISGPIIEVNVDFNSVVKKDQVLARIDPRLFEAAYTRDLATLQTQNAEVERVTALLRQAERNEKRGKQLQSINRDYLSDAEYDQLHFNRRSLEAQLKVAKAAVEQAMANLKNSKANLDYCTITSPEDGIVIERKVDPGQTVASSFQTPELFVLAIDLDRRVHIFASVDEADIGQVRTAKAENRPVSFTVDAYPGEVFTGKIYQIRNNSTTTQNVVTYPVVIEAPNPDMKLMPGMTANISFLIEGRDNVLRIPTAALRFIPPSARVRPEDRKYLEGFVTQSNEAEVRLSATQKAALARTRSRRIVWVQEEEWLRAVPVLLGLNDNLHVELVEGELEEGQELVSGIETATVGVQR
jgi:HlyD family secretion protein